MIPDVIDDPETIVPRIQVNPVRLEDLKLAPSEAGLMTSDKPFACKFCIHFIPGPTPKATGRCTEVATEIKPEMCCNLYETGKSPNDFRWVSGPDALQVVQRIVKVAQR